MLGCAFGGIVYTAEQPHVTSDVQLTAAVQPIPQKPAITTNSANSTKAANSAKAAAPAMKTVTYHGYSVSVPSSWPVYSLDKDPSLCVRYDINAVISARPGPTRIARRT